MKKLFIFLCVIFNTSIFAGNKTLLLATTTSTDNTGLLDYLAPKFELDTGIKLKWVAVGTGEALVIGKNCDADVLLVHAPMAEQKYVRQGYGIDRTRVMYNYFVIAGPKNDPAKIKGLSVLHALRTIAGRHMIFISRGDDSGTNKKELQLWHKINYKLPAKSNWYLESGQGMLTTLRMASAKNGYTLTDMGTYLKYANNKSSLVMLVQGDKNLRNQYSVILLNPKRCPKIKLRRAKKFRNWLVSKKTQAAIAAYHLQNQRLFIPDAN